MQDFSRKFLFRDTGKFWEMSSLKDFHEEEKLLIIKTW